MLISVTTGIRRQTRRLAGGQTAMSSSACCERILPTTPLKRRSLASCWTRSTSRRRRQFVMMGKILSATLFTLRQTLITHTRCDARARSSDLTELSSVGIALQLLQR